MSKNLETAYKAFVDDAKINGAVLCARDASGRFNYSSSFGSRTLLSGEQTPHHMSDILYIASCTKFLTTVAALQCVEDGLLSLNDDVGLIVPELKNKEVLTGYSEDGKPLLEAQKYPITLELLLTHSSGSVYPFAPEVKKFEEVTGQVFDKRPTIAEQGATPLWFQPGKGWAYGLSIDWVGKLVERVTEQKLGDYFNSRIFAPFGKTDISFFPVREDLRDRMVDLNPSDPKGEGLAVLPGLYTPGERNDADHFGGGGMYTSAESFLEVLGSILADDGKLLKSGSTATMFKPHLTPEALVGLEDAIRNSPVGPVMAMGLAPEVKRNWGLGGLLIDQDVEGWFGEGTMIWGGGLNSNWFIDRKEGLCGFAAPQPKLPLCYPDLEEAKQTFRKGVYEAYREWKDSR